MCVLLFRNLNSGQYLKKIYDTYSWNLETPLPLLNLYKFDINRLPLVDILLILVPSTELLYTANPHYRPHTLTYNL